MLNCREKSVFSCYQCIIRMDQAFKLYIDDCKYSLQYLLTDLNSPKNQAPFEGWVARVLEALRKQEGVEKNLCDYSNFSVVLSKALL